MHGIASTFRRHLRFLKPYSALEQACDAVPRPRQPSSTVQRDRAPNDAQPVSERTTLPHGTRDEIARFDASAITQSQPSSA